METEWLDETEREAWLRLVAVVEWRTLPAGARVNGQTALRILNA